MAASLHTLQTTAGEDSILTLALPHIQPFLLSCAENPIMTDPGADLEGQFHF